MDDETFPGYWTIQRGDIIIRGLCDCETATDHKLFRPFFPHISLVENGNVSIGCHISVASAIVRRQRRRS